MCLVETFASQVGEVIAVREAGERVNVSLLETERRELLDMRTKDTLDRLNRYRASQGLKALGDLDDEEEDAEEDNDNSNSDNILRAEASRILADFIALSRDERLITQHEVNMK